MELKRRKIPTMPELRWSWPSDNRPRPLNFTARDVEELKAKLIDRCIEEDGSQPDPCWLWQGALNGYGRLSHGNRKYLTHRVAYHIWVGPIPEGMWVLHKCNDPRCLNPKHLELGDAAANTAYMMACGRLPNRSGDYLGRQFSPKRKSSRLLRCSMRAIRRRTLLGASM